MIDEVLKVFKKLDAKDFRILTGIETGMKHFEWVPVEELNKYTKMPFDKLEYRLKKLVRDKLVVRTTQPYEGFQIYFEGYDALALNAFVKRKSISAIGDEIGVGKESVIFEAIRQPELAIGEPFPVIIKFHREGRTSFKQIKRVREHLGEREHFSWIYAARLAAQREYEIMSKLYPQVSVPKPLDQNRHAIVMEIAKGSLLSKTKVVDPEWYLDEILNQAKITYSLGVIHADLSEYNIFVSEEGVQLIDWPQYVTLDHPHADEILERDISNILTHFSRKYDIKRELGKVLEEIKSRAEKSSVSGEKNSEEFEEISEEGNFETEEYGKEEFEAEEFETEEFETFETEEFEAEEFEAEDLEPQDLEKATPKKDTSGKD
ncbi:Serine/threonine protein kinase [Methanosarcina horonobensis HB-1 = JCM 15518]|uniref:non-specific serine/threonine protein kinase n=1 Tax=Methanosarcina horonobensis HB-1 = JCM 15518 TaxID=1434110 RepID=A0A0E3SDT4_9EURY|nr:serine/threonine-protein kinase RIO2 [Methanosarcina horonobensis]AKB79031.1 Serine/threonine protein kinase [Methanosarcina horonobensis HB-1 = JCM 15518]